MAIRIPPAVARVRRGHGRGVWSCRAHQGPRGRDPAAPGGRRLLLVAGGIRPRPCRPAAPAARDGAAGRVARLQAAGDCRLGADRGPAVVRAGHGPHRRRVAAAVPARPQRGTIRRADGGTLRLRVLLLSGGAADRHVPVVHRMDPRRGTRLAARTRHDPRRDDGAAAGHLLGRGVDRAVLPVRNQAAGLRVARVSGARHRSRGIPRRLDPKSSREPRCLDAGRVEQPRDHGRWPGRGLARRRPRLRRRRDVARARGRRAGGRRSRGMGGPVGRPTRARRDDLGGERLLHRRPARGDWPDVHGAGRRHPAAVHRRARGRGRSGADRVVRCARQRRLLRRPHRPGGPRAQSVRPRRGGRVRGGESGRARRGQRAVRGEVRPGAPGGLWRASLVELLPDAPGGREG